MSPSMRRTAAWPAAAGNDSTLVGLSMPRQSRLSARIAASSVSTIASSPPGVRPAASRRGGDGARARSPRRRGSASQSGDRRSMSIDVGCCGRSRAHALASRVCALAAGRRLRRCAPPARGGPRPRAVKRDVADALDAVEQLHRLREAGGLARRQVDLARIAGDDHAAVLAEPGEEHLHLHRGGVLRLVEDDGGVRQRAAAHEGERRDLDLAGLQRALDDARVHQVVRARRRSGADRDRPSRACRRAGSRAARRLRPPAATG